MGSMRTPAAPARGGCGDGPAESVGQDEVLEAPARSRTARCASKDPPIERAATSITKARPSRTRSSAWTGPSVSPSALVAPCGGRQDGREVGATEPGRCHIERLLEKRAVERVGLVEDGEHAELAVGEHGFHGYFGPGHEPLDEKGPVRCLPGVGGDGPGHARWPATASATVSARITPWLPDNEVGLTTQGKPTSEARRAELGGLRVGREDREGRLGHLRRVQEGPHD